LRIKNGEWRIEFRIKNGELKMKTEKENIIAIKSYAFAVQIVRTYQQLSQNSREFVLSRQLLRSGTSIGANVKEAAHAQSKHDFLSKMNIALKEANETEYWLKLLHETNYINVEHYEKLNNSCNELISILVKIVSSTKQSLGRI
jgi:four helix bundle protein